MRQLGINYLSFPGQLDYLCCAKAARKAGFDLIELPTRIEGEIPIGAPDATYQTFRARLDSIGIGMRSTTSDVCRRFSLTSRDRDIREKSKQLVRGQLYAAAALGCDATLILLGPVTAEESYGDAWKYGQEALTQLAEDARQYRVRLCVENVWNNFLLSPLEMKDMVSVLGNWVGCYFDMGNVVRTGYPEQWVEILGPCVYKVHVKDYQRDTGTMAGFCRLGEGDVDFARVVSALDAVGYADSLIAEMHNVPAERPADELLREIMNDMKRLLSGRQEE